MSMQKYIEDANIESQQGRTKRQQRPLMQRIWAVAKSTFVEFGKDKASLYGAALSFFSVFALPPLLVLLVMLLSSVVEGTVVQAQILAQVRMAGGETGAEVVRTVLENANRPEASSIFAILISLGVLAFSASNVFIQLQDTLNVIWGVRPNQDLGMMGTIQKRLLSFGMILSLGFLVVMLLITDLAISVIQTTMGEQLGILSQLHLFKLASLGVSFVVLTFTLAGVFKVLPDVDVDWKDVLVGATFTAILLSVSKYLIGFYLGSSDMGSAYGAAGSTILFLFWLYLNIQIFLLGAEFTESYAREFGGQIKPSEHAHWIPGYQEQQSPSDEEDEPIPSEPSHEQSAV